MVRSRSGDRKIARTSAIGFCPHPPPPVPILIPPRSRATTSSGVSRGTPCVSRSLRGASGAAPSLAALPRPSVVPLSPGTTAPLRSLITSFLPVDERLACPVTGAEQGELEGEALLEAVGPLDVDGVDAVQ